MLNIFQFLPARGDKADHCWYHLKHSNLGDTIFRVVNQSQHVQALWICFLNLLPTCFVISTCFQCPFRKLMLGCPISPFLEWLRALLTQLFSKLDEIRWDLWADCADCADWAEVERTPGWPETGTASHQGISASLVAAFDIIWPGRMDEGWTKVSDVSDVFFFLWPLENLTGHSAIRAVCLENQNQKAVISDDLRWDFQIQPSKSAKCPTLDIAKVVIFLVISQASP